jgi:hypothetical protein
MFPRILAGVAALALLCPHTTSANWFRSRPATGTAYYPGSWLPAYRAFYYPPTYVYYVPAVAIPTSVRPLAAPTAAPPSVSEERPYPSRPSTIEPPKVTESRATLPHQSREPPIVNESGTGAGKEHEVEKRSEDLCRVGFLNLSPRDLVLKIDGTSRPLARGERLSFVGKKQFVWQIVGSEAQLELVPDDKRSLDIVLRR